MAVDAIEKAIRNNFPGKTNKELRATIRDAARNGNVLHIQHHVALTAFGRAGLHDVQKAINKSQESQHADS